MALSPRPLRLAFAGTCSLALSLAAVVPVAVLPAVAVEGDTTDLTLLATTDVHANLRNWDYFRNAENPAGQAGGLTRVTSIVNDVEGREGAESVVYVDNGDAIQGTPLATQFSVNEPVTETGREHPVAAAYNLLGLDAQTVGNHEFNYGLANLKKYRDDLKAPVLGANVIDVATGEPALDPYALIHREIDGTPVTVGVVGVVVPGVSVWDRAHVQGVLEFQDVVTAAQTWVPEVAKQADVVVVLAHSGLGDVDSATYDPAAKHHDVAKNVAELVDGVDVVVAGHSHSTRNAEQFFTGTDGRQVLVTQPEYWGRSVSEVTIPLVEQADGSLDVEFSGEPGAVTVHDADQYEDDPEMLEVTKPYHDETVEYVNTPVAQSIERMATESSRYVDTPIIDFINHVQRETVTNALAGTEYENLPVVSQASPFSRTAVFPQGQVTIADVAGLYIYDNTLGASLLTGAQLKDYLEYSASYYAQVPAGEEFDPEKHTNAPNAYYKDSTPDYALDQLAGVDYQIDLSKPVGQRISGLAYSESGAPVRPEDEIALAVNNYRQSGGSGYPHVADAPVIWNELLEVRQLLIDWATDRGAIDPADFADENWRLVISATSETPQEPGPQIPEGPMAELFIAPGLEGGLAATSVPVPAEAEPLAGDFLGQDTTRIAVRQGNAFVFADENTEPVSYTFGRASDDVVVGDWNADGRDDLAVVRGATWYFDWTHDGGEADASVTFGRPGDTPLAGDFDGDGADSIAVRRDNVWHLAEGRTNVTAERLAYGTSSDTPLVGDWDGDGADTFGVRRGNLFLLTDDLRSTVADIEFTFGRPDDHPLVGAWNGGADTVGVMRR